MTTEDSENNRNNRLKPKRKKLFFLLGLGLLGGAGFLGLQMIRGQSFHTILFFPSARGITRGMSVTYWGAKVGEVMGFEPEPKGVAVDIKIWPADRLIPRDSLFKLSRVEGENTIDIQPRSPLPAEVDKMTPKSPNCDPKIIFCNTKRISSISRLYWGNLVYSLNSIQNINSGVQSIETSVEEVSSNVQEMKGTVQELGQLGQEVQGLLKMDKIDKTLNKLDRTFNKLDKTLTSVEQAADNISLVAQKAGKLSDQGTGLIETVRQTQTINRLNSTLGSVGSAADQVQVFMKLNQNNLKNTLISIEQLSTQVTLTVRKLDPLSKQIEQKKLLENLEIIARNAAELTTNLNEVSTQLKDPRSHLQIQQIMDSAQSLLNNLNKITSDVDELTGNPSLRRDILRLIQGLTNLLSSTQLLQQQVAYDKVLNQVAMERDRPKPLQP